VKRTPTTRSQHRVRTLHAGGVHVSRAVSSNPNCFQPNVIWTELRFDKLLGTNLRVGDVLQHVEDWGLERLRKSFSAIVGNPPFLSTLTDIAAKSFRSKLGGVSVPDNQLAYAIAERCIGLLEPHGRLCLIQPHGFLYNEKARRFQTSFIRRHEVDALLDFTSIRSLFDGADPKTIAIVARNSEPSADHRIRHLTFRRTFTVQERVAFELDHYDVHVVPQSTAEQYPLVWRTNLLGGGRLFSLALRMHAMPKLRAFIAKQQTENLINWSSVDHCSSAALPSSASVSPVAGDIAPGVVAW
jgi:hypothetical protein